IVTTGNARADMLDRRYMADVLVDAEELRANHGPYVLVNTNYASINPREGDTLSYFRLCVDVGVIDPNSERDMADFRTWCRWEHENVAAICAAIRTVRDFDSLAKIIVRPHPSENLEPWNQMVRGIDGVSVIREGDHLAWTLGSELLLHTSCTTGLEAFLLDHPVLSLTPGDNPWHELYAVNHCTPRFTDPKAVANAISRFRAGDQSVRGDRGEALAKLRPHLIAGDADPAAERTITALARIAPNQQPSANLTARDTLREVVRRERHVVKAFVDLREVRKRFQSIAAASGWRPSTQIQEIGPSLFQLDPPS
ncbi:MAG: hypothetical protein HOH65_01460, partial [Rhodospirillaceae bacterium]|nr:hypothetical protein [Rhodospirillaceae bacterium]